MTCPRPLDRAEVVEDEVEEGYWQDDGQDD